MGSEQRVLLVLSPMAWKMIPRIRMRFRWLRPLVGAESLYVDVTARRQGNPRNTASDSENATIENIKSKRKNLCEKPSPSCSLTGKSRADGRPTRSVESSPTPGPSTNGVPEKPRLIRLKRADSFSPNFVVFDLETSGFGWNDVVLEIAARSLSSGKEFHEYLCPSRPTTSLVTDPCTSTGLSVEERGGQLVLLRNGVPVDTKSGSDVWTSFVKFLSSMEDVVLCAHNCRSFDSRFLFNELQKLSLSLPRSVLGMVDTRPVFIQALPGQRSYSLGQLHQSVVGEAFVAHSAVEDVAALCRTLERSFISDARLMKNAFTVESLLSHFQYLRQKHSERIAQRSLERNNSVTMATFLLNCRSVSLPNHTTDRQQNELGESIVIKLWQHLTTITPLTAQMIHR